MVILSEAADKPTFLLLFADRKQEPLTVYTNSHPF
jgi:hypothetical protein